MFVADRRIPNCVHAKDQVEKAMGDEGRSRTETLEVMGLYQVLLSSGDWERWGALWADDGVLEFPFAPEGKAKAYQGRVAIVAYMREAAAAFEVSQVKSQRVHTMSDPAVACVELSISAVLRGADQPYEQSYVVFFEVSNRLIKRYREYWNPLSAIKAYGSMDEWMLHYPDGRGVDG